MHLFYSIKLIGLSCTLHGSWHYLTNIGSLSYADLNVWCIWLHNKKAYFKILQPIPSVKHLSIWKLSSPQGLVQVFQNTNFHLMTQNWSLTKILSDIFLEVTCFCSLLRKCVSNTELWSTIDCLLGFILFFWWKKQLDQLVATQLHECFFLN